MRRLLVLAVILTSALMLAQTMAAQTPVAQVQIKDTPETILSQENAFWKAYADGNAESLSKLFLADFTNVEQEIWNRDQVLAFVKSFHESCTLAPVKILEPHVKFLTSDIATVVYHATETPTCGSRTLSGETNISTVWVRRDQRWQMQLHTEYAIPPK